MKPASDQTLLREAAAWIVRLREHDAGERDNKAFIDWLKQSPVHVQHYLELVALEVDLAEPDLHRHTLEELRSEASANVIAWSGPGIPIVEAQAAGAIAAPLPRRQRRWFAVAAVVSVLTLAALLGITLFPREQHYQSAVGELRSITLEDGSVVTLNTQTELRVRYTAGARLLELDRGEALFGVAKDAARPFQVRVDDRVIEALGTQFNVHRRVDGVVLTVVEGRVSVMSRADAAAGLAQRTIDPAVSSGARATQGVPTMVEVGAGEQFRLGDLSAGADVATTASRVARLDESEVARLVSWTQRRLAFNAAPVAEVVAELNRYNHDQLRVDDPDLALRQVTGTFNANDLDAFVGFLQQEGGVVVRTDAQGNRRLQAADVQRH